MTNVLNILQNNYLTRVEEATGNAICTVLNYGQSGSVGTPGVHDNGVNDYMISDVVADDLSNLARIVDCPSVTDPWFNGDDETTTTGNAIYRFGGDIVYYSGAVWFNADYFRVSDGTMLGNIVRIDETTGLVTDTYFLADRTPPGGSANTGTYCGVDGNGILYYQGYTFVGGRLTVLKRFDLVGRVQLSDIALTGTQPGADMSIMRVNQAGQIFITSSVSTTWNGAAGQHLLVWQPDGTQVADRAWATVVGEVATRPGPDYIANGACFTADGSQIYLLGLNRDTGVYGLSKVGTLDTATPDFTATLQWPEGIGWPESDIAYAIWLGTRAPVLSATVRTSRLFRQA